MPSREQLESLRRKVAELKKREDRKRQAGPGGLMAFVRYFWDVLEPNRKLVDGWALDAVCLHLEAVSRGEITRLLINVPPGFMKPVHVDELILTGRGFVRLGDVVVGDTVLTHRGRYRAVTAVHEQGVLPLLRVSTWQGRSVLTAPDHPFLTTRGWVAASELTPKDYVAIPRVKEYKITADMKPEEARLLGYLVGDGCISQRSLNYTSADPELIEDFIACAKACGFHAYEVIHPNKKVTASRVILKSTEGRWGKGETGELPVLQWLTDHGLYRSNSYTKRIPDKVFQSGPEAIANFVGAYWSCDGCVVHRHTGNKTTMMAFATTVSKGLAEDLQRALMVLNIQTRVRVKTRPIVTVAQPTGDYTFYEVMTSERNEVAKIAKLPHLLSYKRKLAENAFFDRFEADLYADNVTSVEPAGSGECRCLTVDEDASFTVNGIAVHNSLLVNVFWPAWEWSALGRPHMRYISFSYASHLTERDNRRMLDLLLSPEFKRLWGDNLELKKAGEKLVSNTATGWKLATSVGGVGTGERGDRILCFPGDELVHTEQGYLPIGEIVRKRLPARVWSTNVKTGETKLQAIKAWRRNPGSPIVRVKLSNGHSVRCTPSHRIWTQRGWIEAECLQPGDMLPCYAASNAPDAGGRNAVQYGKVSRGFRRRNDFADLFARQLGVASVMSGAGRQSSFAGGNAKARPCGAVANAIDGWKANAVLGSKFTGKTARLGGNLTDEAFIEVASAIAKVAMDFAVGNVFGAGAIFEVAQRAMRSVAVFMSNLLSIWAWANEGVYDELMAEAVHGPAVNAQSYTRVSFIKDRAQHAALDLQRSSLFGVANPICVVSKPFLADHGARNAVDAPKRRNEIETLVSNHGQPLFASVVHVENCGHADETFCLEVDEFHTFYCGSSSNASVLVANCDDPHNVKESESTVVRTETVRWFREAMSNRLNDMETGVIVVIMQRVHESDVSGTILNEGFDYVHLMIPMEYDGGRHCATSIGWEDPRTEDGEIAWPERFSANIVAKFKRELGPWGYPAQYQQTPTARGGGIFRDEWWSYHETKDGTVPSMDYIIASCDTAYTAKQENDYSACVVLGVWTDDGVEKVMVLDAWQKRLVLHGTSIPRLANEKNKDYAKRAGPQWGLIEWIAHTCKRWGVDRLVVENRASGASVAQEIRRQHAGEGWGVLLVDPKGDKEARAHSVIGMWTDGLVHVPVKPGGLNYAWVDTLLYEMAMFPRGAHDDMTDALVQGVKHLKQIGRLSRHEERDTDMARRMDYQPVTGPLYEC